jgi:hypothetical protein
VFITVNPRRDPLETIRRPPLTASRRILHRCGALALLAVVSGPTACSSTDRAGSERADTTRTPRVTEQPGCLGSDARPAITSDRVGNLPLHLTVDSLRKLCSNARDTTTVGDEVLFSAVTVSTPGLTVTGSVGEGREEITRVPIDPLAHVTFWTLTGTNGVLPKGMPITATRRELGRSYGPAEINGLNGTLYVRYCVLPRFTFQFDPQIDIRDTTAARDSANAATRATVIMIETEPPQVELPWEARCKAKLTPPLQ